MSVNLHNRSALQNATASIVQFLNAKEAVRRVATGVANNLRPLLLYTEEPEFIFDVLLLFQRIDGYWQEKVLPLAQQVLDFIVLHLVFLWLNSEPIIEWIIYANEYAEDIWNGLKCRLITFLSSPTAKPFVDAVNFVWQSWLLPRLIFIVEMIENSIDLFTTMLWEYTFKLVHPYIKQSMDTIYSDYSSPGIPKSGLYLARLASGALLKDSGYGSYLPLLDLYAAPAAILIVTIMVVAVAYALFALTSPKKQQQGGMLPRKSVPVVRAPEKLPENQSRQSSPPTALKGTAYEFIGDEEYDYDALKAELTNTKQSLQELETKHVELLEESALSLANFHQIVLEKDEHIRYLQADCDTVAMLLGKASDEEKRLHVTIAALEISLATARAEATAVATELQSLLAASREVYATEEAHALRRELTASGTSLSLAKSRLDTERIRQATEQLVSQQLRDLLERVESELASAQSFILETEYEIQSLNKEHEEQRGELEGNLSDLKESLVAAEEEKFLLSQHIEEAEHNVVLAKIESDAALAAIKEELSAQLEVASQREDAIRNERNALATQLQEVTEASHLRETELLALIERTESSFLAVQAQLQLAQEELTAAERRKEADLTAWHDRVAALEEEQQIAAADRDRAQKELDDFRVQQAKEIQSLNDQLTALEDQLKEVELERLEATARTANLENEVIAISDQRAVEATEHEKKVQDVSQACVEAETRMQSLLDKLEVAHKKEAEEQGKLEALQSTLAEAEEKQSAMQRQYEELNMRLAETEESSNLRENASRETIAKLEGQLEASNSVRQSIFAECDAMLGCVSTAKQRMRNVTKTVSGASAALAADAEVAPTSQMETGAVSEAVAGSSSPSNFSSSPSIMALLDESSLKKSRHMEDLRHELSAMQQEGALAAQEYNEIRDRLNETKEGVDVAHERTDRLADALVATTDERRAAELTSLQHGLYAARMALESALESNQSFENEIEHLQTILQQSEQQRQDVEVCSKAEIADLQEQLDATQDARRRDLVLIDKIRQRMLATITAFDTFQSQSESELSRLRGKLDGQCDSMELLKNELQRSRSEADAQLADATTLAAEQEMSVNKLVSEVEALRQQHAEALEEVHNQHAVEQSVAAMAFSVESSSLQEELQSVRQALSATDDKKSTLLRDLLGDLESVRADLETARSELQTVGEELGSAQKNREEAYEERDRLLQTEIELLARIEEKSSELVALRGDYDQLLQLYQTSEDSCTALRQSYDDLQVDLRSKLEETSDLQNTAITNLSTISSLERSVQEKDDTLSSLTVKCSDLQSVIDSQKEAIRVFKSQGDAANATLSSQLSDLQVDMMTRCHELEQAKSQIANLEDAVKTTSSGSSEKLAQRAREIAALEASMKESQTSIGGLEAECDLLRSRITEYEALADTQRSEIEHLREEKQYDADHQAKLLQESIEESKSRLDDLQQLMREQEEEKNRALEEKAFLEAALHLNSQRHEEEIALRDTRESELRSLVTSAEARVEDLTVKLSGDDENVQVLRDQYDTLKIETEHQISELSVVLEESKVALQEQVAASAERLLQQRDEFIAQLSTIYIAAEKAIEDTTSSFESRLSELSSKLTVTEERHSALIREVVPALREQLESTRAELEAAKCSEIELSAARDRLEIELTEAQEGAAQTTLKNETLAGETTTLEASRTELLSDLESKSQDLAETQARVVELEDKVTSISSCLDEKTVQCDTLSTECIALKQQVQSIDATLETAKAHSQEATKKFTQKIKDLREESETKSLEIVSLQNRVETADTDLVSSKQAVEALERELRVITSELEEKRLQSAAVSEELKDLRVAKEAADERVAELTSELQRETESGASALATITVQLDCASARVAELELALGEKVVEAADISQTLEAVRSTASEHALQLSRDLEEKTAELDRLTKELDEAAARVNSLEESLETKTAEYEASQQATAAASEESITSMEQRLTDLQAELTSTKDQLSSEVDRLLADLAAASDKSDSLANTLEDKSAEASRTIESLENHCAELETIVAAKVAEIDVMKADFELKSTAYEASLSETAASATAAMKIHQEELEQARDTISELEESKAGLTSFQEVLKAKLLELSDASLQGVCDTTLSLDSLLEKLSHRLVSLESRWSSVATTVIPSLRGERDSLLMVLDEATAREAALFSSMQKCRLELEDTRTAVEGLTEEKIALEASLESAKTVCSEKDLEIQQQHELLAARARATSELEAEVSKLSTDLSVKNDEVIKLAEECTVLNKVIESHNSDIAVLKSHSSEATVKFIERINELRGDITGKTEALTEAQQSICSLEQSLAAAQADASVTAVRISDLEDELVSSKADLEQSAISLKSAEDNLADFKQRECSAQDTIEKLQSAAVELNDKLELASDELLLLQSSKDAVDKSVAESLAVQETLQNQLAGHIAQIADLENLVANQREEMETLSSEKNEVENTLTQAQTDLEDKTRMLAHNKQAAIKFIEKVKELKAGLETKSSELSAAQSRVEELETAAEESATASKMTIEEHLSVVGDLQKKIDTSISELKTSSDRVKELEMLVAEREVRISELGSLKEGVEADFKDAVDRENVLSERIAESNALIADLRSEAELLNERISESENSRGLLEEEVVAYRSQKIGLENQVNELQKQVYDTLSNIEALRQHGDSVSARLLEAERSIEESAARVESITEVNTSLQHQLTVKGDELEVSKKALEEGDVALTAVEVELGDAKQRAQETIERLRTELQAVTEENASSLDRLAVSEDVLRISRESEANLSEVIESLRAEIAAANNTVSQRSDEVVVKSKEIDSLTSRLAHAQQVISQKSDKIVDKETAIFSLKETIASYVQKSELLSSQICELTATAEERAAAYAVLQQEKEDLLVRLSANDLEVETKTSEVKQLESSIHDLRESLVASREEVSSKQKDFADLQALVDDLHDTEASLNLRVGALEADICEKENKLLLAEQGRSELQQKVDVLEETCTQHARDLLEKEASLSEALMRVKELEEALANVSEMSTALEKKLEDSVSAMLAKMAELQKERDDAVIKVADTEKTVAEQRSEMQEVAGKLEAERDAALKCVDVAKSDFDVTKSSMSESIDSLSRDRDDLNEKLLQSEESLKQKMIELETASTTFAQQQEQFNSQIHQLNTSLSDKQRELDATVETLRALEIERDSLVADCSSLTSSLREKEVDLADVNADHDDVRATLDAKVSEMTVRSVQLEETVHALEEQLKERQSAYDCMQTRYQQQVTDLEVSITSLGVERGELSAKVEELNLLVESKSKELENASSAADNERCQVSRLQLSLQEKTSELEAVTQSLEQQRRQADDFSALLESTSEQLATAQAELLELRASSQADSVTFIERINELKAAFDEKSTETDTLKEEAVGLRDTLATTEREKEAMVREAGELDRQKKVKLSAAAEALRTEKCTVITLKSALSDLQVSKNQLQTTIDELEEELEAAKAAVTTTSSSSTEVTSLLTRVDVLAKELSTMKEENDAAREALLADNDDLKGQYDIKVKELAALSQQIDDYEREKKKLEEQVINTVGEVVVGVAEVETDSLEKELELVKEDLARALQKIEKYEAIRDDDFEALKEELKATDDARKLMIAEFEATRDKLVAAEEALELSMIVSPKCADSSQDHDASPLSPTSKNRVPLEKYESLLHELSDSEKALIASRLELVRSKREADDENYALQEQLQKMNSEHRTSIAEYMQMQEQLRTSAAKYLVQVAERDAELCVLRNQVRDLMQSAQGSSMLKEELRAQLKAAQEQLSSVIEREKESMDKLKLFKEEHAAELAKVRRELLAADEAAAVLDTELRRAHAEIAALQTQLEALRRTSNLSPPSSPKLTRSRGSSDGAIVCLESEAKRETTTRVSVEAAEAAEAELEQSLRAELLQLQKTKDSLQRNLESARRAVAAAEALSETATAQTSYTNKAAQAKLGHIPTVPTSINPSSPESSPENTPKVSLQQEVGGVTKKQATKVMDGGAVKGGVAVKRNSGAGLARRVVNLELDPDSPIADEKLATLGGPVNTPVARRVPLNRRSSSASWSDSALSHSYDDRDDREEVDGSEQDEDGDFKYGDYAKQEGDDVESPEDLRLRSLATLKAPPNTQAAGRHQQRRSVASELTTRSSSGGCDGDDNFVPSSSCLPRVSVNLFLEDDNNNQSSPAQSEISDEGFLQERGPGPARLLSMSPGTMEPGQEKKNVISPLIALGEMYPQGECEGEFQCEVRHPLKDSPPDGTTTSCSSARQKAVTPTNLYTVYATDIAPIFIGDSPMRSSKIQTQGPSSSPRYSATGEQNNPMKRRAANIDITSAAVSTTSSVVAVAATSSSVPQRSKGSKEEMPPPASPSKGRGGFNPFPRYSLHEPVTAGMNKNPMKGGVIVTTTTGTGARSRALPPLPSESSKPAIVPEGPGAATRRSSGTMVEWSRHLAQSSSQLPPRNRSGSPTARIAATATAGDKVPVPVPLPVPVPVVSRSMPMPSYTVKHMMRSSGGSLMGAQVGAQKLMPGVSSSASVTTVGTYMSHSTAGTMTRGPTTAMIARRVSITLDLGGDGEDGDDGDDNNNNGDHYDALSTVSDLSANTYTKNSTSEPASPRGGSPPMRSSNKLAAAPQRSSSGAVAGSGPVAPGSSSLAIPSTKKNDLGHHQGQ